MNRFLKQASEYSKQLEKEQLVRRARMGEEDPRASYPANAAGGGLLGGAAGLAGGHVLHMSPRGKGTMGLAGMGVGALLGVAGAAEHNNEVDRQEDISEERRRDIQRALQEYHAQQHGGEMEQTASHRQNQFLKTAGNIEEELRSPLTGTVAQNVENGYDQPLSKITPGQMAVGAGLAGAATYGAGRGLSRIVGGVPHGRKLAAGLGAMSGAGVVGASNQINGMANEYNEELENHLKHSFVQMREGMEKMASRFR